MVWNEAWRLYFVKTDYEIRALADETIKGWTITTMTATSDGTIWIRLTDTCFDTMRQGKELENIFLNGKDKRIPSILFMRIRKRKFG